MLLLCVCYTSAGKMFTNSTNNRYTYLTGVGSWGGGGGSSVDAAHVAVYQG